jgi:CHAT domain-containing protein/tetratricopeptide (TPR) repeat protein
VSYNNVAYCLNAQGQHARALPLFEKALGIHRKLLGEAHPHTAVSYNNVAYCLNAQGQHARALPLFEKALAIRRQVLGEEHPDTAANYNNVASCLNAQGLHRNALPLFEKALAISRKVLGEWHPDTALSYNNVASCLLAQRLHARALPLYEKAAAISRRALGEEHLQTAQSANNLAYCLQAQGRHAHALPLYEHALAIYRKVLGEKHPQTARSLNRVAACLNAQGQHDRALPLLEKALASHRKLLGDEHPDTALSYNDVALCLVAQGRHPRALPVLAKALAICRKGLGEQHPHTVACSHNVAWVLWRLGRTREAVLALQASQPGRDIARQHRAASGFDRAIATGRDALSPQLLAVGLARLGQPRNAFRQAEAALARGLLDDLDPVSLDLPASMQNHLRRLDARLLPLFGSGPLSADQRALREELVCQRRGVLDRLADEAAARSARQVLPLRQIQRQLPARSALVFWVDVDGLGEHWACVLRPCGSPAWLALAGSGPGGGWTAPDLALAGKLARLLSDPRTGSDRELSQAVRALRRQRLEPLGEHLRGIERLLVVPTSWAARVPVEVLTDTYRVSYVPSGSVLARLRKNSRPLRSAPLLALGEPAFKRPPAPVPKKGALPPSVVPRGPEPAPLPGTRHEVRALARLVPAATVLLGSEASEQGLHALASRDNLKAFRLIHLATHCTVDLGDPERSALLLARDRLPDPLRLEPGQTPFTGELTVDAIRRTWKLDADLVVMSACETALGQDVGGDGLLGFAHAFLSRGARALVLSRWKVDDTATALLMVRFYENFLGKRPGLKAPLGRAAALDEARAWLRGLSRQEASRLAAALTGDRLRGTVGPALPPLDKLPRGPAGARPYAHPFYWAAFVLIGDPD